MRWVVTGAAGYIGSHVARAMLDAGVEVVALDDLSTGVAERIDPRASFVEGTLLDDKVLDKALAGTDGVVHLAAKLLVAESNEDPLLYYEQNIGGLARLLDGCRRHGVGQLVFSSSAACYGNPRGRGQRQIAEGSATRPINPYGETKLACEWLLRDCARAYGLRVTSLRYFNVAGAASPELVDHRTMHLIPIVLDLLAKGQRPRVFGLDYPTHDGSCIRDYVHVADVADAHLAAVRALEQGSRGATYNIGRNVGSSVLDVLSEIGRVLELPVDYEVAERRVGDPAALVASTAKIQRELGWTTTFTLEDMIRSSLRT